jgi:hypothetical protein
MAKRGRDGWLLAKRGTDGWLRGEQMDWPKGRVAKLVRYEWLN